MLEFGFQEEPEDLSILIKDEEDNDVDIADFVTNLNIKLGTKVNTFQGNSAGNKVMVTDENGNIIPITGVVMNQAEREKLAAITNPLLLKGILQSYEALYLVENPQQGWCYLIPFKENGDNIFKEYMYTNNRWELLGNFNLDLLLQYFSGIGTEIDLNRNVNVKYNPDTMEIDENNRLKAKTPSKISDIPTSPSTRIECKTGKIEAYGKWYGGRYWNEDLQGIYALTIGNGTGVNDLSEALTLTWDGTSWTLQDVTCGGTKGNPLHSLSNKLDKQAIINNIVFDFGENADTITYINARSLPITFKSVISDNIATLTLITSNSSIVLTSNNITTITIAAGAKIQLVIQRTTENQSATCGITYSYNLN